MKKEHKYFIIIFICITGLSYFEITDESYDLIASMGKYSKHIFDNKNDFIAVRYVINNLLKSAKTVKAVEKHTENTENTDFNANVLGILPLKVFIVGLNKGQMLMNIMRVCDGKCEFWGCEIQKSMQRTLKQIINSNKNIKIRISIEGISNFNGYTMITGRREVANIAKKRDRWATWGNVSVTTLFDYMNRYNLSYFDYLGMYVCMYDVCVCVYVCMYDVCIL